MAGLIPLKEAQARLFALAAPLPVEHVPVAQAAGRYLIEPVVARRTQPSADLSAMDGYALRTIDMPGPWRVIGESAAGHPFAGHVGPGQAVRISTGALLPAETDMVLMQEDSARAHDTLRLTGTAPAPLAAHVRRRGMDFTEGDALLAAGTWLGPAQIALVLSGGHNLVALHPKPVVAIIEIGDELAVDPVNCPPHQIPASNGAMIAALAAQVPCIYHRHGPIADDMAALIAAFDAAGAADVIVTSGSASVGDHDLLQPALLAWGAEIDYWKIAIKPGKPLLVARKDRQIVIGLPGNPVSSHVTAFLFLLPLLRVLAGSGSPLPRSFTVPLAAPLPPNGTRREFIRAVWDGQTVRPVCNQDSSALSALAASNALIDRPAGAPAAAPGRPVQIYQLPNGAIA